MKDKVKTKRQLEKEIRDLRRQIAELESADDVRKQREKKTWESDKKYRALFDSSHEAFYIIDQGTERILDCNKKASDLSGYTVRELKTMSLPELYPAEEQDVVSKIIGKVSERGSLSGISGINFLRKDGNLIPVEVNATTLEINEGKYICGIIRDIAIRKKSEDALRESEEKARAMSDASLDAIVMIDGKGIISYFNKAAEKMLGYRYKEVRGKKLHELIVSDGARKKYYQDLPKFEQTGMCSVIGKTLELFASKKDGTRLPIELSISSFRLQGEWHSVAAMRDISLRKEMETRLRELSMTDDLTGLLNRRGFFTLADQQRNLTDRSGKLMLLLFTDIDNMKSINDQFGHEAGDQALQDTAGILRKTFRKSDIIARMGGDEFAVLMTGPSGPEIEKVIIDNLGKNLGVHNEQKRQNHALSLSTGIAYYDPTHPCSINDLLARADASMYDNKNRHKGVLPPLGGKRDRRAHERFLPVNAWAKLNGADKAGIKDISEGGICLHTSKQLDANGVFKIKLSTDESGELALKVAAVWSRERSSYHETGLKFTEMPHDSSKVLVKYLNSLK